MCLLMNLFILLQAYELAIRNMHAHEYRYAWSSPNTNLNCRQFRLNGGLFSLSHFNIYIHMSERTHF
jgi:hypothetical protein